MHFTYLKSVLFFFFCLESRYANLFDRSFTRFVSLHYSHFFIVIELIAIFEVEVNVLLFNLNLQQNFGTILLMQIFALKSFKLQFLKKY